MFYCECLLKYWQWITCNFSCERHTKGSSTTLDSPSGWKSSPGKIFHWNSYDARTSIWNSVRATPKAAKTTLSTERQRLQRLQTFTETATKYYNYTANETDEERDHQLLTLQDNNNSRRKRWGEATLEVYIQTYLLRYNDRQKKFTTTRPKNSHEEYLSSGLRTVDQPFDRDTRISSNYDQWNWFLVKFNVK